MTPFSHFKLQLSLRTDHAALSFHQHSRAVATAAGRITTNTPYTYTYEHITVVLALVCVSHQILMRWQKHIVKMQQHCHNGTHTARMGVAL